MRHKPFSILVVSIIYLVSPIVMFVINSIMNLVPLFGPGNILFRLSLSDIIILSLYPITAISVFLVKKWGWWIFIINSALLIGYNVYTALINPMTDIFIVLLFNLILCIGAGIFFRKQIIAPYFNPRLRIWDQASRYDINIVTSIKDQEKTLLTHIKNISLGGCFVYSPVKLFENKKYRLNISIGNIILSVNAKVVREFSSVDNYTGYGMIFEKNNEIKEKLVQVVDYLKSIITIENDNSEINKRKNNRYNLGLETYILFGNNRKPVHIINVSKTGLCLEIPGKLITEKKCVFQGNLEDVDFKVDVIMHWLNKKANAAIYGVSFENVTSNKERYIKKMIKRIKKFGVSKQIINNRALDKIREKSLPETPYKIILKIRELLGFPN